MIVMEVPPVLSRTLGGDLEQNVLVGSQDFRVVEVLRTDGFGGEPLTDDVARFRLARHLSRQPYFRSYRSYLVMCGGLAFTVNLPPGS